MLPCMMDTLKSPGITGLFTSLVASTAQSGTSGGNKQIDAFFHSRGSVGACGRMILSGYDGDGTAGCQHSKAKGGELIEMALRPGDYPGTQILKTWTAEG